MNGKSTSCGCCIQTTPKPTSCLCWEGYFSLNYFSFKLYGHKNIHLFLQHKLLFSIRPKFPWCDLPLLISHPTAPAPSVVAPFFRPSKTLFLIISQFPYPPSMARMGFMSFKGSSKDFGMSVRKFNQERNLLRTSTSCRKLQNDSFRIFPRKKWGKHGC